MSVRIRPVVTCFITRSRPHGPEVLLLKRSSQVNTYKNHWACVSGSIEGDEHPTFRAHTELFEETQLRPPLLEFVRTGPTLTFFDKKLDTQWKIHPFLFSLPSSSAITEHEVLEKLKIDWEHTECKWVRPEEIKNYQTVPKLEKALNRAWLEGYLDTGLKRLQNDHLRGARELAIEGLGVLAEFFDQKYWRESTPDDIWEEILVVGWHIAKNGRPAMSAAIGSAIISTLGHIHQIHSDRKKSSFPASVNKFALAAKITIDAHIRHESNTLDTLCDRFAEYFMNEALRSLDREMEDTGNGEEPCHRLHILTLSNSSTLFHCLHRILTNPNLPVTVRLTILESRPLYDGVSLAVRLLQNLPKVSRLGELEIIPDASVAFHISSATHVLLGADKIYLDGDVWNKTGSLAIALLANYFDVPLLIVSQTSKVMIEDIYEDVTGEENGPEEMSASWGEDEKIVLEENAERVHVMNGYFELVSKELIDGYITEMGTVNSAHIRKVGERRKSMEQLLFGWL